MIDIDSENKKLDTAWTTPEDLQPLIEQDQLLYDERRRTIRALLDIDVYAPEYDVMMAIIELKNNLAALQQQKKQEGG